MDDDYLVGIFFLCVEVTWDFFCVLSWESDGAGRVGDFFCVLSWDSDGAGRVGDSLCFFIIRAIVRIRIFEFFIQFIYFQLGF